jgi:aspartate--ammonia ligase
MNSIRGIILKLIGALFVAQEELRYRYPQLPRYISEDVSFITTQKLEDAFPELTPTEREYEWGMEHNVFCLTQIGHPLESGKPHGERSPDYDDWSLNFDIFIKYPLLNQVIEIGGGGIRVMGKEMLEQIQIANWKHNIDTPYHNSIINNTMLSTIGGAFGSDRIGMILTGKAHIAETRPSVWDEQTLVECKNAGVDIM